MRYLITVIVVIAIVAISAALYYVHRTAPLPHETGEETASSTAALADDLYPLYGGVAWNAPHASRFDFGTTTFAGAEAKSATTTDTMNPASVFAPFGEYYDAKLKAAGWAVDNQLAAGGHTGGVTGYRKGSAVILASFSILYKNVPPDAPSECPCDVSVSLFSSVP